MRKAEPACVQAAAAASASVACVEPVRTDADADAAAGTLRSTACHYECLDISCHLSSQMFMRAHASSCEFKQARMSSKKLLPGQARLT
eukprot:6184842-Pleurochrysis_carterae.AAC.2